MNKRDFYYKLPEKLIAQTPIKRRDYSRLLTYDRKSGETGHIRFYEILKLLKKGDCLVLNDSKVLPARLFGKKQTGGAVEILLLRDTGENIWECLVRPGKKARRGAELIFGDGELTGTITDELENGNRLIKLSFRGIFPEILERLGKTPLPPYIKEELEDTGRYQTVYSREPGSAAAPTAGLHYTRELLNEIQESGINICYITLHVGIGTFRPVKTENIEDHIMHSEYCEISAKTADIINETKKSGGRVIATGTTVCRTLEAFSDSGGHLEPVSGFTDIFIKPGYKFKITDGLITNFHLPESTLIMLVSAFAGTENIIELYNTAVSMQYRFFSFGDAMFLF